MIFMLLADSLNPHSAAAKRKEKKKNARLMHATYKKSFF
jgi:hypothetical protein